jgi:hypothetical protein
VSDKPKRRWYQFSLKTLLAVMTLLCVGPGGYVAYEQGKSRQQKRAVETIRSIGSVDFDDSIRRRSAVTRVILGDDSFSNVVWIGFNPKKAKNRRLTDADLRDIQSFSGLKYLGLGGCQTITDAGLRELSGLESLAYIYLEDTQITDAGLMHLSGLKKLQYLSLYNTHVSSNGVDELQKALPNCKISYGDAP